MSPCSVKYVLPIAEKNAGTALALRGATPSRPHKRRERGPRCGMKGVPLTAREERRNPCGSRVNILQSASGDAQRQSARVRPERAISRGPEPGAGKSGCAAPS
jgi:hypothetical protein